MRIRTSIPIIILAGILISLVAFGGCSGGLLSCSPLSCLVLGDVQDLGVKWTQADLQSALGKIGMQVTEIAGNVAPKDSLKYSGQKTINTSFSDSETSALLNNPVWQYNPLREAQAKFTGNTAEVAGRILTDRAQGFMEAFGATGEAIKNVMDTIKQIGANPPIYLKGTASVVNNRITSNIAEAAIGRFSLPQDQIKSIAPALAQIIQSQVFPKTGANIKSLVIQNGKLLVDGTFPAVKNVLKLKK